MINIIRNYLRHNESFLPNLYRKIRRANKLRADKEREFLLQYMREGSVGAEIGVHRGEFAYYLLKNVKPNKLYLIDVWEWSEDPLYEQTLHGGRRGGGQRNMDRRYQRFKKKFKKVIDSGQVEVLKMYSDKAATKIEDNSLDWVYIDADHTYKGVTADLVNYFPKIKSGGYIIGDDYDDTNWFGDDVQRAVSDFIKSHDVEEVEYKNIQYVLRKK